MHTISMNMVFCRVVQFFAGSLTGYIYMYICPHRINRGQIMKHPPPGTNPWNKIFMVPTLGTDLAKISQNSKKQKEPNQWFILSWKLPVLCLWFFFKYPKLVGSFTRSFWKYPELTILWKDSETSGSLKNQRTVWHILFGFLFLGVCVCVWRWQRTKKCSGTSCTLACKDPSHI